MISAETDINGNATFEEKEKLAKINTESGAAKYLLRRENPQSFLISFYARILLPSARDLTANR